MYTDQTKPNQKTLSPSAKIYFVNFFFFNVVKVVQNLIPDSVPWQVVRKSKEEMKDMLNIGVLK